MHPFVESLTLETGVPWGAIEDCQRNIDAVRSDLLTAVKRVLDDAADEEEDDRGFLAIYLLAAEREQRLFPLLTDLLPRKKAEELLGGAAGMTLTNVLISCFDGNTEALLGVLRAPETEDVIRNDMFRALAYLAWQGRIDPATAGSFLAEFDDNPPVDDDDLSWTGWLLAIELLGRAELESRLERAFASRTILEEFTTLEDSRSRLRQSLEEPDNGARFEEENLGPLKDLTQDLAWLDDDEVSPDEEDEWGLSIDDDLPSGSPVPLPPRFALPDMTPARNPMRHVGRNDPCPCGSGKKYKRCCGTVAG